MFKARGSSSSAVHMSVELLSENLLASQVIVRSYSTDDCSSSSENEMRRSIRSRSSYLQGLGEQKRTKYKINGTATIAVIIVLIPDDVLVCWIRTYKYEYMYVPNSEPCDTSTVLVLVRIMWACLSSAMLGGTCRSWFDLC